MQESFHFSYPLGYTFHYFQTIPNVHQHPFSLYSYSHYLPLQMYPASKEIETEVFLQEKTEDKHEALSFKPESEEVTKKLKKSGRLRSPKKNVECNIVNQCYSFLTTRSKSQAVITKLLVSKQRIKAFYKIMRQGRKKQNRYIGRNVLEDLVQLQDDHPVYIIHRKQGFKANFKISELRQIVRIALNYFIKKKLVNAILTSSKLDRSTVRQHLRRSREILEFLNRKPSY